MCRTISRTPLHHALLLLLSATALLILTASCVLAEESYPNVNNAPIRLRLLEGLHGRGLVGARLTLTGGYDERDLKLGLWRAEIQTDANGEATLPRMIANLPLLTIKGPHLSVCEGKPQQGYYSVEQIRVQGLSTVNGCGSARADTEPGLFTLIIERKTAGAKIEKKHDAKLLKVTAKNNHQKIYAKNGELAPAETAPDSNTSELPRPIAPAQPNFAAPVSLIREPTHLDHQLADPLKPALFTLNTKPPLVPTLSESEPARDTIPELTATLAPTSIIPTLSAMGMANGIVAGAQIHSTRKSATVQRTLKKTAVKPTTDKKSPPVEVRPSAKSENPPSKPIPTPAHSPAPSTPKSAPPPIKPTTSAPLTTPGLKVKPKAGK